MILPPLPGYVDSRWTSSERRYQALLRGIAVAPQAPPRVKAERKRRAPAPPTTARVALSDDHVRALLVTRGPRA